MATAEIPAGLAAMPAGPGLAAALHPLDLAQVPNDRLLDVLTAQYRQLCHDQARMAAVLVEIGRSDAPAAPGEAARTAVPGRYTSAETRAALRWTRHAAELEHDLAETVVHGMPLLFAAWLAGAVDRARVRVFDQYLTGLSPERTERVCRVAVPRASKLTTGQLARLLRRMVIAVDPDAAARWYRKGVRDRTVTAYPAPDGTITISAHGLPADEAEAACERIQQWAAAAKRAGHPGRIGQIRADLFLGLLDGRFHAMTRDQVIAALIAGYRPSGPAGPVAFSEATGRHDHHGNANGGTGSGGTGGSDVNSDDDSDSAGQSVRCTSGAADSEAATSDEGTSDEGTSDGGSTPRLDDADGAALEDQRVGIEVRVGLATLLGLDEHPAEIPGLGLLIAPDARHRVSVQGRAAWRFAVTDPDGALVSEGRLDHRPTGTGRAGPRGGIVEIHVSAELLAELAANLTTCGDWAPVVTEIATRHAEAEQHLADLDTRPGDRLPAAALRRHTQIRDRTCTFAGVCRHPARHSDIDHTHDHATGGTTVCINLGPLCGHDHDVKHRGGWTVTQSQPGVFTWHSPLGGAYLSRGEILLPELPEPVEPDPDPWPGGVPRTFDGPILRRPPPPAPDPPPSTCELLDEPPF